jgi:putative oxidoreductase
MMESIANYHEAGALLIARIFLGLLFLFQGYDAIFGVKLKNVVRVAEGAFRSKGVPQFMVVGAAWFTSLSQFIGGLLLISGLFKYGVLYVLGLDLIVAAIGFGITSPMWDTKHVFPRLALLIFLLMTPPAADAWSLDNLLFSR